MDRGESKIFVFVEGPWNATAGKCSARAIPRFGLVPVQVCVEETHEHHDQALPSLSTIGKEVLPSQEHLFRF